ncbi:MAG: SDR family NAD(P)-dependent oxidoreductase [Gammaproteobacteria bacterium]|nr:MAG: SDR family NAD(P)-dependent oxidoreductase [Gammaproteobacteria bacterium]
MNRLLDTPITIWLTGASSGIGESLARELAMAGHKVIATGRSIPSLDTLAARFPGQIIPAPGDVTDYAGLASISATLQEHQPIQLAVLNAGTCEYLDAQHFLSAAVESNVTTNLFGATRSVETVLPFLRQARHQGLPARLAFVSSSAWWFPFARAEGYGASKAALSYFARSLRADLASEAIPVTVVSPGFVRTPLTDRNDFPMPFLIPPEEAARSIFIGLRKGHNEIQFPKRFTWMLKIVSALPQALQDRLAASMARPQPSNKETQ